MNRDLFLRVGGFHIGPAQEVVHADTVKIGQLIQGFRGNVPSAVFVVGVAGLGAVQQLRQILLLQVTILPKVADSPVHSLTPFPEVYLQYIQNVLLY